jgi:hypothetical protein
MVHQIGDLGILIDYGNNTVGSVLQHQTTDSGDFVWQDYTVDGKPVTAPIDVKSLPPGEYRLV